MQGVYNLSSSAQACRAAVFTVKYDVAADSVVCVACVLGPQASEPAAAAAATGARKRKAAGAAQKCPRVLVAAHTNVSHVCCKPPHLRPACHLLAVLLSANASQFSPLQPAGLVAPACPAEISSHMQCSPANHVFSAIFLEL
jgi:hypothetical protein